MSRRWILVGLGALLLGSMVGIESQPVKALPPAGTLILTDAVVSNTDATLENTETAGDGETSIAVNPLNPDEIVITAFSGCWTNCGTTNAPLFHSLNGGVTWTKQFTIPPPPGLTFAGCPCDQTVDFDRQGNLFYSVLVSQNVVTGFTDDPADATRFQWNGNPAQVTDQAGTINPDQPWMITNPNPANLAVDNVYVGYDDFTPAVTDTRVSVSQNAAPPNFTIDNDAGDASTNSGVNPGLRMAGDRNNGDMYVIYQQGNQTGITWRLNRSTDGGATWTLNGDANGIVVGTGPSRQGNSLTHKFGDVNALIGGVDHLAVDPRNGDVLVVYGTAATPATANGNTLFVRRIVNDAGATMTPQAPVQVTAAENAALPSIAVAADGTVGLFYYTFDGFDGGGNSTFSTRFDRSFDGGATWSSMLLQSFTAPVQDDGNSRQRIFFDYNQVKAVGNYFFGTYTGGGETFGHPDTPNSVVELDPIFFALATGATPTCPAVAPTIVGTAGPDDLTGTSGDDVIFGMGNDDRITGLGGNDIICGGGGQDQISGGAGNDQLFGDDGRDRIAGGDGNDLLVAGIGNAEQLTGGNGDDSLNLVDGAGGDQGAGSAHVNGDTCVFDTGDALATCNP